MGRFVEYICIVGAKSESTSDCNRESLELTPAILHRLPKTDRSDYSCPESVELFAFPDGLSIKESPDVPRFFTTVLTGVSGDFNYLAILLFDEKFIGEEFYVPKAICIISRHPFYEEFKLALIDIYKSFFSASSIKEIDKIFIRLLSTPNTISFGIEPVNLNLSPNLSLQVFPSLCSTIPVTDKCVYFLVRQLGIVNLITVFKAALLDNKILFISSSHEYLRQAATGLAALLYPLVYIYVFIPNLPSKLTHVLNAPTPFIIGVHSSLVNLLEEHEELVKVNLDLGSVKISKAIELPSLPKNLKKNVRLELSKCLFPDIYTGDLILAVQEHANPETIDKQIRSIFMLLMVKLLHGFSTSIIYLRVHPRCVIRFEEKLFHEKMQSKNDNFFLQLAKSSLFNQFVTTRGIPYRQKDIFDKLLKNEDALYKDEFEKEFLSHITYMLIENETLPNKINFNSKAVNKCYLKDSRLSSSSLEIEFINSYVRETFPGIVIKPSSHLLANKEEEYINMRDVVSFEDVMFPIKRVDYAVIKQTIELLFKGKINIVRQILPKVETFKHDFAAIHLICVELKKYALKGSLELSYDQFMIVSNILRICFKLHESRTSSIVAYSVINLSCRFYTLVNGHKRLYLAAVMNNLYKNITPGFWAKFYYEYVGSKLCKLYDVEKFILPFQYKFLLQKIKSMSDIQGNFFDTSNDIVKVIHPLELVPLMSPLLVGNEIACSKGLNQEEVDARIRNESNAVLQQAYKFIDKIIKCTFDVDEVIKLKQRNSTAGTQLSNFIESECIQSYLGTLKGNINTFIDTISTVVDIKYEHVPQMRQKLSDSLTAYFRTMDESFARFFTNSTVLGNKLQIQNIHLLSGEVILNKIEAFILPNGINYSYNSDENSNNLFPAYGTVYITNYKLYFTGYSMSSYMSQVPIIVNLPHGLIKKMKTLTFNVVSSVYNNSISIQSAILIKSNIGPAHIMGIPDSVSLEKYMDFSKYLRSRFDELTKMIHLTINLVDESVDSESKGSDLKKAGSLLSCNMEEAEEYVPIKRTERPPIRKFSTSNFATIHKLKKPNKVGLTSNRIHTNTEKLDDDVCVPRNDFKKFYLNDYERMKIPYISENIREDVFCLLELPREIKDVWKSSSLFGVLASFSSADLLRISKAFKHKRFPILSWCKKKTDISNCKHQVAILRSSEVLKSLLTTSISQKKIFSKMSSNSTDLDFFFNNVYHSYCVCNPYCSHSSNSVTDSYQAEYRLFRLIDGCEELYDEFEDCHNFSKVYLFGCKAALKNVHSESSFNLLNFELPDSSQIKQAYSKLIRASTAVKNKNRSYSDIMTIFSQSNWLKYLAGLLEISCVISFTTNICNSFCHIAYGDGTDEASQITCLAQIMLDPYYRTFKGFLVLIDKEWIAYRHRFISRNGILNNNQNSFIPYFFQFMDCVHQILLQYPNAFQYNDFFLRFITYHSVSNRFMNFLIGHDSKSFDDYPKTETTSVLSLQIPRDNLSVQTLVKNPSNYHELYSDSFFNFVLEIAESSTLFYNAQYIPGMHEVLYPSFHIASMDIWDFYFAEENMQYETYDIHNIDNLYRDFKSGDYARKNNIESKDDKEKSKSVEEYINVTSFYGLQLRALTRNDAITKIMDEYLSQGVEMPKLIEELNKGDLTFEPPKSIKEFILRDKCKYGNKDIGSIHRCYMNKFALMKIVTKNKTGKSLMNKLYFNYISHSMNDHVLSEEAVCSECDKVIPAKTSCVRCRTCFIILHSKCSKFIGPYCNFDGREFEKFYISDFSSLLVNSESGKNTVRLHMKALRDSKLPPQATSTSPGSVHSTSQSVDECIKEPEGKYSGYLCSKSNLRSSGKRRFYFLDHSLMKLFKFGSESKFLSSSRAKAKFIDLKNLVACNFSTGKSNKTGTLHKKSDALTFELTFRNGNIKMFAAPTLNEAVIWVSSFKKLLNS